MEEFVSVGPREYLDRLLSEYGLLLSDVEHLVRSRKLVGTPGSAPETEWLIHHSVLRPHGSFRCAGDAEANKFCDEVATIMVELFGIGREEAIARINRQWSAVGSQGWTIWIVGLSIAYHKVPEYWAKTIYYGPDAFWWLPDFDPIPLPPPPHA